MIDCSDSIRLLNSSTSKSLRNKMADAQSVTANSTISDCQLTIATKLVWSGAFFVCTVIEGWGDFLILLFACGMQLLIWKKHKKLGRVWRLKLVR